MSKSPEPQRPPERLTKLRTEIDSIDKQIITLLAKRMALVGEVGQYKKGNGIHPLDSIRWRDVLNKRIEQGKELGLDGTFVVTIYERIHEEALKKEKNLGE